MHAIAIMYAMCGMRYAESAHKKLRWKAAKGRKPARVRATTRQILLLYMIRGRDVIRLFFEPNVPSTILSSYTL